ncbi:hypothetical protein FAEPRAA2165_01432 [Faecalibacterium duncaniae]|uniref:Uncharacterized protein n=1 Tax=Faecalibacterium duncaniae (strain DSM 17677 / JCM 31915 / A2-165) TaxID=411483 RepID=C7H562_FAED2|nr:hypothetical protein FAEPRAA2165_01432 [Faecalibacterium duncaniae]
MNKAGLHTKKQSAAPLPDVTASGAGQQIVFLFLRCSQIYSAMGMVW